MADTNAGNITLSNAKNHKSPLQGVSTEEQDLSTGHGGSKFQNSIMENNLAQGSRVLDNSLLDNGS